MKITILAAAVAAGLACSAATASAGSRDTGNAIMGAGAGFLVFGPVGAVAGAAVGYTSGEGIARSWRGSRRPPRRVHRTTHR